ncbi:hypothetical protein Mal4_00640 [Maioricimonas rarisocia]|uniref:Tetratricopeptide repeat protein n=1 Tax=Maioricimonas rarisocia TaxID=2528026 RepID=A0A517YZZ4_9PLAN|nr:hypothetical protein [Maioricimonas rarisocia]QDU35782.1 hypothetical protein Mal4_00640 [Maioricimonas rarisocia]
MRTVHRVIVATCLTLLATGAHAEDAPADKAPTEKARATAVALNYCRAAFHRIRKDPSDEVLAEEQEKILSNLKLDSISDPDIIKLYSSVLDEINDISVADRERTLARSHHMSTVQRKVAWDVLAMGTDIATGQFGNALRTGANSWWDYRNMKYQHENSVLKIDKGRLNAVVQKSSQFLDTFWRMAQKENIPDRWLVRNDDLDALEVAMSERDPEVRLRVLKRMESFMECYPPYWYYVARTQQETGELVAAAETYRKLEELGMGHFRKDDMLATGLANQAAIEEHLGYDTAPQTAQRALEYSTEVWEANLVCARVLQRHGRVAAAEDAILRNLDVGIETSRSRVFLASLYIHTEDRGKLAKVLADREAVAELPAPILLRCAALMGVEQTPPHVLNTVLASLDAQPRMLFGPDDLVIHASRTWQLHLASLSVWHGGQQLGAPQVAAGNGYYQLRYAGQFDWGSPLAPRSSDMQLALQFTYPDETQIRLTLQPPRPGAQTGGQPALTIASSRPTHSRLQISDIRVGEQRIALHGDEAFAPQTTTVAKPVQTPLLNTNDETGSEAVIELNAVDAF